MNTLLVSKLHAVIEKLIPKVKSDFNIKFKPKWMTQEVKKQIDPKEKA